MRLPGFRGLVFLVMLVTAISARGADPTAAAEEQAVYAAIFVGQTIAMLKPEKKTEPLPAASPKSRLDPRLVASVKERFPGAAEETIVSYYEKVLGCFEETSPAVTFAPDSKIGAKLILIDREIVKELSGKRTNSRESDAGWALLYERFGVISLTSVAPIGFNAAKTQALVLASRSYRNGSEDVAIFLEKADGQWRVKGESVESKVPYCPGAN